MRSAEMPQLPSGLTLALSRDAVIEHTENWFACPDGHFWFWAPAPELGAPPYSFDTDILQMPEHAAVPTNREEVKAFIRVLELHNGLYCWRGEWLADFPKYTTLDAADAAAWHAWLNRPAIDAFLYETIERCAKMAEVARTAVGYVVGTEIKDRPSHEDGGMWIQPVDKVPGKSQ
jgi:hypothetical protein